MGHVIHPGYASKYNTYHEIEILGLKQLRCPYCRHLSSARYIRQSDNLFSCKYCRRSYADPTVVKAIGRRIRKRKLAETDFWTRTKFLKFMKHYESKAKTTTHYRNLAMWATCFFTGARVSEVVGYRATENYKIKHGLSSEDIIDGKYIVRPLQRWQFQKSIERGIPTYTVEDVPVLKKKMQITQTLDGKTVHGYKRRTVKMPYEAEKEIVRYIENYLSKMRNKDDDAYLFPICREQAWLICYSQFGKTFPHFFRHIRASDLGKTYGFSEVAIKLFFKWASVQSAERYSHMTENEMFALAAANIGAFGRNNSATPEKIIQLESVAKTQESP